MTRLGDLATFKGGSAFPQKEQGATSGFIPFMKVSDLSRGTGAWKSNDAANWLSVEQLQSLRPMVAPPGSTVFAKIGEGLRSERCRLLAGPSAVDNNMMAAIPTPLADPSFLYYLLKTVGLSTFAVGSALPYLRQSTLNEIRVTVPDKAEQRAIGEALGSLDHKIAANTQLAGSARDLAGLMYDRSADKFRSRPMSEVLRPILGGTPVRSRTDFWDGDQLWASAGDITGAEFGVLTDTVAKITRAAVTTTKAKALPSGSVILTARGTVGAVARLAFPASFNQSCYGFAPGEVPPGVLYFAIMRATQKAKDMAHGSVFDTITMKTFDNLDFPAFDSDALLATEAQIGPILEIVTAAVTENQHLAGLRDALLPQLISGNLRVKDAERELEDAGV